MRCSLLWVCWVGLAWGTGCSDDAADSAAPSPGQADCEVPAGAEVAGAGLPDGLCVWQWAGDLSSPRGILVDASGDVLVVAQGDVLLLHDADGDGVSRSDERVMLASAPGLDHGLALDGGYLYASSESTVYRWPYAGGRTPLGEAEAVIAGIPRGGHSTRTLVFDEDFLYVSVGSASNVDRDSSRARIRRFPIDALGAGEIAFDRGEVFADGLRNEVGLAFDSRGRLWGVENGRDQLQRDDFDPRDVHQDNPAEELNLFAEPGRFYGYPYCWSEYALPAGQGMGPGTQWADPSFIDDGTHTDAWCRDTDNVVPPALAMQGHSAPLDILFYDGQALPDDYVGDAIVTFHGSWNRDVPTGYKVMRIPFGKNGMPSGQPEPLLEYAGKGDLASGWPHRPVGLATLPDGTLLITSDASGRILAVASAR